MTYDHKLISIWETEDAVMKMIEHQSKAGWELVTAYDAGFKAIHFIFRRRADKDAAP